MAITNKLRIGILGASGYTGAELLRLLARHPGVEIKLLTADRQAGKPIAELAVTNGASDLWKNLPVLIIVLAGGFTTNLLWCGFLNIRNRTAANY